MISSSKNKSKRRAAVIGGGPSGIQAAGQLMKLGFQVTVFERHAQLGGIWYYERNEHLSQSSLYQGIKPFLGSDVSPVYKNLRTTVTFQAMGIDRFPIPRQEEIRFVHRSEILDYINAYVSHLEQEYPGLTEYRFNANIESVTYDHGWSVISREQGNAVHDKFDVVVVATGAFQKPYVTNLHEPEYDGICFHSFYYDDPSALVNRTVLIVGGGNSAKDIFWDAMEHAKHVVLACPSEQDRNNVVLLENDHAKLLENFTSVGRVKQIQKDGTIIHTNWQGQDEVLSGIGIDMVIYCTGYKREFPFFSEELQPNSVTSNGKEVTNCFLFAAHKDYPNSLFFFHPAKARTTINTLARDTYAQAQLIASLADQEVFTIEQFERLDETLLVWMDVLYKEWVKEVLTSCECFSQHTLFVNYLTCVVDYADELSKKADVGSGIMDFVRNRMKDGDYRKQNTIWHAGLELRQHADVVNWNRFRSLRGKLIAGPDVDGSEFYTVIWYLEDGSVQSTFREDDIKYEDLILNG